MSSIEARNNIRQPLYDAIVETSKLLGKNPGEPMLLSINEQLQAINMCVTTGSVPAENFKEAINIGVIAIREFEASHPVYAASLMKVNYYFTQY